MCFPDQAPGQALRQGHHASRRNKESVQIINEEPPFSTLAFVLIELKQFVTKAALYGCILPGNGAPRY